MIVAGGGIIGLSCAWRLSQAGLPVTVFDKGECGGEASWAGAGMLAPGGEFDAPAPLAEMAIRSLTAYPSFLEELQRESEFTIDFRQCGALELALSPEDREALDQRADRQRSLGIASRFVPEGRFFPGDAIVNPREVTQALKAACLHRGVQIHEHEPVLEIPNTGKAARTSRGEYQTDGVLIAAGAWSSELIPDPPQVFPVRGLLLGYHLSPGLLPHILRHEHTYLLQRGSGFLIAGSTTERVGFNREIPEGAIANLHRRAARLLPELLKLQPDEAWIGFRPGIDAEEPRIGRIENTRIWTAYGHYRNGILLAPETARTVAVMIV